MELGAGEGALARGLDLAVRLPPLYLMDMILIQVISHAHFIRPSKLPYCRCSESGSLDETLNVPTNTSPPCGRTLQLDGDHRQLVRPLLHLRRALRGQSDAPDLATRGQILPLLIAVHYQPPCLPPTFQPGVLIFNLSFMEIVVLIGHGWTVDTIVLSIFIHQS